MCCSDLDSDGCGRSVSGHGCWCIDWVCYPWPVTLEVQVIKRDSDSFRKGTKTIQNPRLPSYDVISF